MGIIVAAVIVVMLDIVYIMVDHVLFSLVPPPLPRISMLNKDLQYESFLVYF